MTFSTPFNLPGYPGELPAGDYDILVEEELIQGLSFEAYRRTATYLTVRGASGQTGRTELRATTESDLERALGQDSIKRLRNSRDSEGRPEPQRDRS